MIAGVDFAPLIGKTTRLPQTEIILRSLLGSPAENDVVDHFNLQQLPGADQIAGHTNVGLARRRVAARMIMLCEAPSYVQSPIGGADVNSFHRDGGGWLYFPGWMR